MTGIAWSPLLNPPPYGASSYDALATRLGAALGAEGRDVVIVPGEAVVALEAVAREVGAAGGRILNIATSVYGRLFGDWLAAGGAEVTTIAPAVPGAPIELDTVRESFAAGDYDALAFTHGEAATGIVNPIVDLLALARRHEAVSIVDAVASVGAEPLDLGLDGADIVVIGPQKALGGPAAVSVALLTEAGWARLARPAGAPSFSSLSLLDIRRDWIATDRAAIPGTPHVLDLWALDACVAAIETEGAATLVDRHRRAAASARAGLLALGLEAWVDAAHASGLVTGALLPAGVDREAVIRAALDRYGVVIGSAPAGVDDRLVRILHTGRNASFAAVLSGVGALAGAIGVVGGDADPGAASAAVIAANAADRL